MSPKKTATEGVRAAPSWHSSGEETYKNARRYEWLVEHAVITTGDWIHDGRDAASTKQPLDNRIDAELAKGE